MEEDAYAPAVFTVFSPEKKRCTFEQVDPQMDVGARRVYATACLARRRRPLEDVLERLLVP